VNKIILILVVLIYCYCVYFISYAIYNFEFGYKRPENVPSDARLIGPTMDHHWFHAEDEFTLKDSTKIYRFKLFDIVNGELRVDAFFKVDSNCAGNYDLSGKEILNNLLYYKKFERVIVFEDMHQDKNSNKLKTCDLLNYKVVLYDDYYKDFSKFR
jgi:hypothetical protein